MPAIDNCEPSVITALEKEGWSVTDKPFSIIVGQTYLFADLRLSKEKNERIIVEVKCFSEPNSILSDWYKALGQYLSYQSALRVNDDETDIYLCIPLHVYESPLWVSLIEKTIVQNSIQVVIIDLQTEVVVTWKI